MTCSAADCDGKVLARGMCRKHYLRWHRSRNPEQWREYQRRYLHRDRARRNEQAKARYDADPERHIRTARRSAVKRKYGLTLEEYEARIAKGCAICGAHGPRMAMDHDHASGKVREPLCANCNNGLGRFADDPGRLRAAADYLEKHA